MFLHSPRLLLASHWIAAAVLSSGAAHAADSDGRSFRHIVVQAGQSVDVDTRDVQTYAYRDQGDVARLELRDVKFHLVTDKPGQAVLVLFDAKNHARTFVIDVEPSPIAPKPIESPPKPPSLADRARDLMVGDNYDEAKALLLPVALGRAGTAEELTVLRQLCTQLQDKSCLARVTRAERKLAKKRSDAEVWADRR